MLSVSGYRFSGCDDRFLMVGQARRMLPNDCFAKLCAIGRVINTRLAPSYTSAIPAIKKEGTLRRCCWHRPVQYLNNILEQDHRAIKRRVNAKQGFREFHSARRTMQGYEAINMLRKGQVRWMSGTDVRGQKSVRRPGVRTGRLRCGQPPSLRMVTPEN